MVVGLIGTWECWYWWRKAVVTATVVLVKRKVMMSREAEEVRDLVVVVDAMAE